MASVEKTQQRRDYLLGQASRTQALAHTSTPKSARVCSLSQQSRELHTRRLCHLKKEEVLINSESASAHLQSTTKVSHGVTSKRKPIGWTSHSTRSGAYVLLSEGSDDDPFINCLRWNSKIFLLFLRSAACIAT